MSICEKSCIMIEHLKDSPEIRTQVIENKTKLKNYDSWIPKIETKVDAIPGLLNGFYLKIMFSLGILNVGTMLILKLTWN